MRKTWIILIVSLMSASAALAQRPSLVTPPEPAHLIATDLVWPANMKGPRDPVARKVWLPEGFTAQVFTTDFQTTSGGGWLRLMALDSNGVLHATDMDAGRICVLPDKNKDGVADTVITVRAGVGHTHSLAFYKGAMYVAETDSIRKFTDDNGDGYYETEHPCVSDLHTGGVFDHTTRTIVIDPKREKLLVSVGTACNACRLEDSLRSVILEYNLDGTGRRIYASGIRNALGLAIEPGSGKLWATNADRNRMGDYLPEEILTTVSDGSFHGWPYAYGNREWVDFAIDSEYTSMLPLTALDSQRVAAMHVAELFLPAHSTPAGVHFYQGDLYPENYRTGYVAVKGSAESSKPQGFKIMRFWQDAAMQWRIAEFMTGFVPDTNSYQGIWARPIGIAEDRDGNMYLSFAADHRMIVRVSFDPSKSVRREALDRELMQLELGADGRAWVRTAELGLAQGRVLFEAYSIAGSLLHREYIAAEETDGGLRIKLPGSLKGAVAVAISTERERLTAVVTIP